MTTWVTCPHCGKRQFPINSDTVIINLQWKCKASVCKQMFMIDTESGQGIKERHS